MLILVFVFFDLFFYLMTILWFCDQSLDIWPIIDFITNLWFHYQSFILWPIVCSAANLWCNDQSFVLWPIFCAMTQSLVLWPTFGAMTNLWCYDQPLVLWPIFGAMTNLWCYDQSLVLWPIFGAMTNKKSSGTKSCLSIGRKGVEFDPDEYQKFNYHRYIQMHGVWQMLREYRVGGKLLKAVQSFHVD